MDRFVARFRSQITGVLSGFDRLVFRGSLLPLIRDGGMYFFLAAAKVRLLDFKNFVLKTSDVYRYFIHPEFGFMGARLQTWFPFNIQVWLNGREWLALQLKRKSVDFKRHDNCFTWLSDVEAAQRLMDKQLETDWTRALTEIARSLNPLHAIIFKPRPMDYYWSAYQSEWATDIMFKDPRSLAALYPVLVRHAMFHFSSADVMRFLGRKAHGNYTGELVTSFKDRPEGVRVKHWVDGNSIKMYDKAGSDLRIETTIAKTSGFKVFRPLHNDPNGKLAWRPLRKGIADLHRRAQVSQRANQNYLDALSTVDDTTPLSSIFDAVSRPVTNDGRRSRAIRIGDPSDLALVSSPLRASAIAISNASFTPSGAMPRPRPSASCQRKSAANSASSAPTA